MRLQIKIALFVATVFITSCQPKEKKINLSVNGIWESVGSGWILQINDSADYSFYDITSISCLPNRKSK